MSAVHQFVAAFEPGAVGQHIVAVRRYLTGLGYESEVFAGELRPFDGESAHHFTEYGSGVVARPDDLLIYHLAIGSEVATFLAGRTEPMVVWYHNITPASFFEVWEPALVPGVEWGRAQLRELADRCVGGIGVSQFNAQELDQIGYAQTAVVPILLDLTHLRGEGDAATRARLAAAKAEGGADAVFVGRVVPNKAQHDLVKLAAMYRGMYGEPLRVHIVGSSACGSYWDAVQEYARRLGVEEAVELTGPVTPAELTAYYRAADVFVSASEHEGFCVPVLEAMEFGVPVVAYAAGAVPETVADAGLLLATKAPAAMAAAVHRVVHDEGTRALLHDRAAARLDDFDHRRAAETLRGVLTAWGFDR